MSMIHLWEPTSGSWTVDPISLAGHTASVEDLQWSPAETNVFASCSVDGTVALSFKANVNRFSSMKAG
ncbi:hypothetical protein Bca4012_075628 [Brassica carinata]|uniref:Uncharacterized protein n=2 Tax=Brassica TaxID=3705 RepID=A0A8S9N1G2_BRACR|nr:hypothetical protein F2Q69_00052237 [Brassica cretica]KAG2266895.1 hypothetical protein Bca52824_073974 [Brassica carinata]